MSKRGFQSALSFDGSKGRRSDMYARRRRARKAAIAKKRARYAAGRLPPRLGQIMPAKCVTKLVFTDLKVFTTGNGVENQVYITNGLYDPTNSGLTGSALKQPRGLDDLAKFYRRYVVNAWSCVSTVHNGGTYAIRANMISSAGTSAVISDIHKDAEQPFSRSITLGSAGARTVDSMKCYHKVATIYGDAEHDASDYGALVTAMPSKQVYTTLEVGAFNVGQGSDKNVQVSTTIVYYCMFYDLRPLGASTGADEPS